MKNYTHIFTNGITCLFIIQLTTSMQAFAQGKFVEGYIITNQNDTIRGLVRYADWAMSPKEVRFRSPVADGQMFPAKDVKGFGVLVANEIYKSKKIGLLDISLTQAYTIVPSLEARDSAYVFLQELVTGGRATLFEFLDRAEHPHYFIEKDGHLKELFYYPFYKAVDNRRYLLIHEEYKEQLAGFCGDSERFKEPLPAYQEKYLKDYVESYNRSFTKDSISYHRAKDSRLTFDLELSAGAENWREGWIEVRNKATFGFGVRVNFPRKFRNRYVRVNFLLTPNLQLGFSPNSLSRRTLKTLEIGVGRYVGSGRMRPYFGLNASIVNKGYRSSFLGMNVGISYNRLISLEVGHFANFNCIPAKSSFLIQPRISLHYFANLKFKQNRIR
ncbi:MAG: hypothetical protein J7619_10960 [Dyadobacter sp.]|uniref:hypothetical protein n=1 Tax=Dyadobacter sp. TaxID=1914288 RepID=UPI001B0764C4|nr:hypothetical protein [Dyadobacter sp.]MBO9613208.1 hypothetical protein [Dyadobacter sp.]